MSATGDWKSIEVFFDGSIYGESCDLVLRQAVRPILDVAQAAGWLREYFFIRYTDGGAHIRLRMRGSTSTLPNAVERELMRANERARITRYKAVTYHPEVVRYGGWDGVGVAEEFFQNSSEAALCLIEAQACASAGRRFCSAALLMLILLHEFLLDVTDVVRLLNLYAGNSQRPYTDAKADLFRAALAPQVGIVWGALASGSELPPPAADYQLAARRLKESLTRLFENGRLALPGKSSVTWDECVDYLLPSQLHMTNNRIGVSIRAEMRIASALRDTLAKIRDQDMPLGRAAS